MRQNRYFYRAVAGILSMVLAVNMISPAGAGQVYAGEKQIPLQEEVADSASVPVEQAEEILSEAVAREGEKEDTGLLIPEEGTLPLEGSALPLEGSALPLEESALPLEESALPLEESALPLEEASSMTQAVGQEELLPVPEEVTISSESDFQIEDGVVTAYLGSGGAVVVPDSVTAIADYAFRNQTSITSLDLGRSVTSIGYNIIQGCTNLTEIYLPDGDTPVEVASGAFYGDNAITKVHVKNTVTSINEAFLHLNALQEFEVDTDSTYYYEDQGVLYYRNSATNDLHLIRMPKSSTIENYSIPNDRYVTAIGEEAFSYCTNLKEITVPAGVITIGDSAFEYCSSLTKADMGIDVVNVGDYAFYRCEALESITISEDMSDSTVGYSLFNNCNALEKLLIPVNTLEVPKEFMFHNSLKEILVGENGDGTNFFTDQGVLYKKESTNISDGSKTGITLLAYPKAKEGQAYNIKDDTVIIGAEAFNNCDNLTSITMPDSLKEIGNTAFNGCDGLTEIVMGKNVEKLGSYAFEHCKNVTVMTLSEKLVTSGQGYNIVYGCTSLTTLKVPAGASYVPQDIWEHGSLKEIVTEGEGSTYFSDQGVLYQRTAGEGEEETVTLIAYPRAKEGGTYEIQDKTTHIGAEAFNNCDNLTSITMPDSLKEIGNNAFGYCDGLTEIVMGKNVEKLGRYAFDSCKNVTSVTLSEKLATSGQGYSIVNGCTSLTTLKVPAGASYVPQDIWEHGSLKEFIVEDNSTTYFSHQGVLYLKESADNIDKITLVSYPRAKEGVTYEIWVGTTHIGAEAFNNCDNLTSITMPDSLKEIGNNAFNGCDGLTEIVMGKNVEKLGRYAFDSCKNVTSVTLSEKLLSSGQGYNIVNGCTSLTTLKVPAGAMHVPDDILQHGSLQNIYVIDEAGNQDVSGNSYSSQDGILYNADKTILVRIPAAHRFTEFVIPDSVKEIAQKAAYDNANMTVITLPAGLQKIGNSAFEYASSLQLIIATGCNPTSVGSYALDANDTVIILCDTESSILNHAVQYGLIYMSGENSIQVSMNKLLVQDGGTGEESLRNYRVKVYLGENAGMEEYLFDAYASGEYVLLPAGKKAQNGDTLDNYDKVTLVLTSKSGECADIIEVVTLDEKKNAKISLTAIQRGYVEGTITAFSAFRASLYDEQGNYLDKISMTKEGYYSDYLPQGSYSLVILQGRLRNWVQDTLAEYESLNMTEGKDYFLYPITITDNRITVQNATLPEESEYASQWLDLDKTKFEILNNEVTPSGFLKFQLSYALKPELMEYGLGGREIIISVPDNIEVHAESVSLDGEWIEAEISGSRIAISVKENSGIIEFTATPLTYGSIISSATLGFNYEGVRYEEYVGSISRTLDYITINVQPTTPLRNILVHGVTVPGNMVTIYDNGSPIGTATAYGSGKWSARVDLADMGKGSLHRISASTVVDGITKTTQEYELIYASNMIGLRSFKLIHNNQVYTGDASGMINPQAVTYNPNGGGFTFVVDIANGENIEQVFITTEAGEGEGEVRVPATRIGAAAPEEGGDVTQGLPASRRNTGSLTAQATGGGSTWTCHTNFSIGIGTVTYIYIRRGEKSGMGVHVTPFANGLPEKTPPRVIYIEYIMKDVSEAVEQAIMEKYDNMSETDIALEKAEMPDMWKNATATIHSDGRDSLGYGSVNFDIHLDNEEKTTLNYQIDNERNVTVDVAALEADDNFVKTFDEKGKVYFTSYHYEETYDPNGVMPVRSGISQGRYQPSGLAPMNTSGTTTIKMGSLTYVMNDYEKGVADAFKTEIVGNLIGKVSSTAGTAAGVVGVYSDIVEVGNNFVSLASARNAINNANISAADKAARQAALDRLMMGYMICAGLRYAAVVVATAAALSGAGLIAGLAIAGIISVMNTFVNKSLKEALDRLTSFDRIIWLIDPSGYVYEAVEDNRIEGATATVYYQDESGGEVTWNAEEYGQINPQKTDHEGKYAWDVTEGYWKVKVTKEGYDPAESDWLPVPPVQTEVNLGLTSQAAPEVEHVWLYQDSMVIDFTQYMKTESVTADKFTADGQAVITEVQPVNAKAAAADESMMLAKSFRLPYTAQGVVTQLTVSETVENYTGKNMERASIAGGLEMTYEIVEFKGEDRLEMDFGSTAAYELTILPKEAAGQDIEYDIISTETLEILHISDADENGTRTVTFNGILPTETYIDFTAPGSTAHKRITVEVLTEEIREMRKHHCKPDDDEPKPEPELPDEITRLKAGPEGEMAISAIEDQEYTGQAIKPKVIVKDRDKVLIEGKDYKVTYKNNKNVNDVKAVNYGTGSDFNQKLPTVTILGKGEYNKKISMNFNIIPKEVTSDGMAVMTDETYAYTKKAIKAETLTDNRKKLKAGKDYTIEFYPLEEYKNWVQSAESMAGSTNDISTIIEALETSGKKISRLKDVGEYVAVIKGKGNYGGALIREVAVCERTSLSKASLKIDATAKKVPHAAGGIVPDPSHLTLKMKNQEISLSDKVGKDDGFIITVTNNDRPGKATLTVKAGKDNTEYAGSKSVTFTITGTPIKKADLSNFIDKYVYNGEEIRQTELIIKSPTGEVLTEGVHYSLDYMKNTEAGKATLTVTGIAKGGYTGTLKKTFKIEKKDVTQLEDVTGELIIPYGKTAAKPLPVLKDGEKILEADKDYKVTYKNTAKVAGKTDTKAPAMVIKGMGNYTGTKTITYSIIPKEITDPTISITMIPAKSGSGQMPKITLQDGTKKMKAGKDYEADFVAGDTGTIVIRGMGSYQGTTEPITVNSHVHKISKAKFYRMENGREVPIGKVSYTGLSHRPELIVKYDINQDGTPDILKPYDESTKTGDYIVTGYGYNLRPGTNKGTITIKGMGEFGGTVTLKFTIQPKAMQWYVNFLNFLHIN